MKTVRLGHTELKVPEIGLGCMRITGWKTKKRYRNCWKQQWKME